MPITNQPNLRRGVRGLSDRCEWDVHPQRVICTLCRREVLTETEKKSGNKTFIWAIVLFFCGGVCCCVPFCLDSCKDTHHKCPNCNETIGQTNESCI